MIDEPLGLPRGSVRAFIALLVVSVAVFSLFYRQDVFEVIFPITSLIIGYYFGRRSYS